MRLSTGPLVYWQGRWITEDQRVLSLVHPWCSFYRDERGMWVLVSVGWANKS